MQKQKRLGIILSILLAVTIFALMQSIVAASRPKPADAPPPFPEYDRQPEEDHSNLPLEDGDRIWDRDLARYITTYLGLTNCHSMKFIFGQCYGGGMIDELADAGITCTLSAQSASAYSETSWSERGSREDDYLKRYARIREMSPTLSEREVAELAREQDTAGPYQDDLENPQHHASGPLSHTVNISDAKSFHPILFAGSPDGARHWNDLKRFYHLLTSTYGYTKGQITVLYGDGQWPTGDDDNDIPFPTQGGIPITAATRNNLTRTLERIGKLMNPNEQFFFWASDHGGHGRIPTNTTTAESGSGNCTGAQSCSFSMSFDLSDAELAQISDEPVLEFYYTSVPASNWPMLRVCINDAPKCIYLQPTETPSYTVVPISATQILNENIISFTILSEVPMEEVTGTVSGAIAALWSDTTQLRPYRLYLPMVLRDMD